MQAYDEISTDGAPVVRAKELTSEIISALFERRICAIHIPNDFSARLARRADAWLQRHAKVVNWRVGPGRGLRTDMNYGIGIPRATVRSNRAAEFYERHALEWMRKTRIAFAPDLSPLDRLRLELHEIWPGGLDIDSFRGKPGNVGIVRVMRPDTLFDANAHSIGVCHIDSDRHRINLSANLYVSMPAKGGALRTWNIDMSKDIDAHPIYRLIRRGAFRPGVRDHIFRFLPPPLLIRPKIGDLVIIDTARPHAVAGFSSGHRTSIQTFISLRKDNGVSRIMLSS